MNEPLTIGTLVVVGLTTLASWRGFRDPMFLERHVFSPPQILRDRQYYRLLTSGLLHANWPHLLFNMFSLYSFGSAIELYFGIGPLLLIYLAGIVGGGGLSLWLHRHHPYRALGASGGVCGIIFASIFLLPGGRVHVLPLPLAIPAHVYAVLFMLASYYGLRSQRGNIAHDAHLGGAIIGLLAATAMYPHIAGDSPVLYAVVVGISLALLVTLHRRPLYMPREGWLAEKSRATRRRRRQPVGPPERARDEQTLDRLLEKISRSGLNSLTRDEHEQLRRLSQKLRQDTA
jgi:membrane associated rhomboid family serine protease